MIVAAVAAAVIAAVPVMAAVIAMAAMVTVAAMMAPMVPVVTAAKPEQRDNDDDGPPHWILLTALIQGVRPS